MSNSISCDLRSAGEIAGQFPEVLKGTGEELEEKQPIVLEWGKLDLIQLGGQEVSRDLTRLIFRRLPPEGLFTVRMVCKLWHQIASTNFLPLLFPQAPFINKGVWEDFVDLKEHGLVFEEIQEPKITKRDFIEIEKMASQVEPNLGIYPISIIDCPKGLSPNKIIAIAKAPKKGNKTSFDTWCKSFFNKYGDIEIKKTDRVIVTNGVFEKSRKMEVPDQEKLVKDLNCDMPEATPFMANIALTFIRSDPNDPLRLFGKDPCTHTRCMEDVKGYKVIIGAGTDVSYDNHPGQTIGVGGQLKFPAN